MTGLRDRARRLVYRHAGGSVLVLMYHRVAELERDPQLLAVSPERFAEHMALVSAEYEPVSLAGVADGIRRGRLPRRGVAVTFDDGYEDNLLNAEPVLASYGVPATVYVSSGYVGGEREFWWDELERILLTPNALPARLRVDIPELRLDADLGECAEYSEDDAAQDSDWDVTQPPRNARHRLYVDLSARLRLQTGDEREAALGALRLATGVPAAQRPSHRQLSPEQVEQLDSSAWMEVGGHTVSHQVLSMRSPDEQREEISADAGRLADLCGRALRTFSYPFGGSSDYGAGTVGIVRGAGYESACTTVEGLVKRWTDPYSLPRHVVRDWPAEEMARAVQDWFHDPR